MPQEDVEREAKGPEGSDQGHGEEAEIGGRQGVEKAIQQVLL